VAALLAVGALGYWLRFYAPVGDWLRDRSGGAAYALFWTLAFAALKPTVPALRLAATMFIVTCGLEFLQAWHPAWLEAIRRTLAGRLILGTTFDWLDFPPYAVGAVLGWAAVSVLGVKPQRRKTGQRENGEAGRLL